MRNRIATFVGGLVAGALVFSAMADVPRVMTFQGKLADTQGHYIEGQRALTFRVYDGETGGAVLWQEQHANTTVTKGIFAVPLGVYQPLNLAFDTNYWVSVEVGSDGEMSPRQRLTASAYAFRAAESEHARTADLATSAVNASNAVHAVLADAATSVANGGLPVGTILPYGGVNVPSGFLKCDGAALSSLTYPALYAALGTAWGSGDGTLDGQGRVKDFRVPDLRGRFMRGADEGVGRDPDRTARTAPNTGGNVGDNVGSVQAEELKAHVHSYNRVGGEGAPNLDWRVICLQDNSYHLVPLETSAYGGSETRPVNAYVIFIIKY